MKNLRKNKRGVALEMAITLLLLVFILCTMMTTFIFVSRANLRNGFNRLDEAVLADDIGHAFVAYLAADTAEAFSYTFPENVAGKYLMTEGGTDGVRFLKVTYANDENRVILSLTAQTDPSGIRVLSWKRR